MTPEIVSTDSSSSSVVAENIVRSAFAADAHCLGPHWVYDQSEIAAIYPEGLSQLDSPKSSYHPGKAAGDLTHHGDQSLALLESLAGFGRWCADVWAEDFASYWKAKPNSYFDGAARGTLENLEKGLVRGSQSDDIAGVSRMAPLFVAMEGALLDKKIAAARDLVGVTHDAPIVGDTAEFVVRTVADLIDGKEIADAIESAIGAGSYETDLSDYLAQAKAELGKDPADVAGTLGQSCPSAKALPLTIWFALSYADQPVKMLENNALVGGDNSARAMILSMLIAASGRYSELPDSWYQGVNQKAKIEAALNQLSK